MTIAKEHYGRLADGTAIERYTLRGAGLEVEILTYGGIIAAIRAPDRHGAVANVVLGLATLDAYVAHSPYFGAMVGRYGNRIGGARFELDGVVHHLSANDGANSLHGGRVGFDRRVWEAEAGASAGGARLVLSRRSPDGEEGYPGNLDLRVTCTVTDAAELVLEYEGTTDRPTVLNPTNHSYFNLAGEGSGSIEGHELTINARAYLPVDAALIPRGAPQPVAGTPFDFTTPQPIGARLRAAHPDLRAARGYDHNFVLEPPGPDGQRLAARLEDPASGRVMEIRTTEPGLQFYSGNFLDGTLSGRSGSSYRQGDGLCLEPQHFPDSPNRPDFPTTVLRPGERFRSRSVYRFSAA